MSSKKDTANLGIGEEQLLVIGLCIIGGVVATVLLVVLFDWLYRRNAPPVVRIELDVESAGAPQDDSVHEDTSAGKVSSSMKPGPSGIGDQMSSPDAYAFSKLGTPDVVQPPKPVAATRGERHGSGHGVKAEERTRHRHRHRHRSRSSSPIGDHEDGRERALEKGQPTRAPSREKVPLAPSRPPAPGLHGSTPAKDEAERRHRPRRHRSDEAGAPPVTSGLGDGNGERRHRHRSSRHLAEAPNTAPIASVPLERTPVAARAHRHHHRDGYHGTTEAPPPRLRESHREGGHREGGHREGGHREAGRESHGRGNSRHPRTSSSSPDDRQHRSRHRSHQDGNHDSASPSRSHHHHETRQRI